MVNTLKPALLTTSDTAAELGVTVKAVRAAVHRGELRAVRVGGNMFLKREEISAYLERLPDWPAMAER